MRYLCLLFVTALLSAAEIPTIKIDDMWPKLDVDLPVDLDFTPASIGIAYLLEQKSGKVLALRSDSDGRASVVLDVSRGLQTGNNEEGLLAMALAPDFASSGVCYLYYTAAQPRRGVLSRFRFEQPDQRINRANEEILLEVKQPWGNHNGADLKFGPDGMLYMTLGDGGAGGDPHANGQNRGTLLGSILRLDVSQRGADKPYAIPKDNPFVDEAGSRPEIWAYGLRNTWRMGFDRETDKLWAADVGQNAWEEVDILVRGGNYGWNPYEGSRPFAKKDLPLPDNHIPPVFEYGRGFQDGGYSITGGFVYRGSDVPSLQGIYVCADYVSGNVWGIDADNPKRHRIIMRRGKTICSFAEDPDGELYVVQHRVGKIGRVVLP